MLKKILKTCVLMSFFSTQAHAGLLWYCSAISDNGTVWNQYGRTRAIAQSVSIKKCKATDRHQKCTAICFPPRQYWRCFSHDLMPKNSTEKPGSWAWVSYSKQIAINGAKDACRYNSAFGGCYVDPNNCASS
ncbi:MAG: hypothetical protein A3F12_00360 [Gammaproteobacteria bacterium RIFCSPHIGHO2_12_FULL_38_14]|nr:MAG: hypothetical protein A3F12_00360 [Gammaproteobacteria bacterium RIFCSPHIGHO2_12_FULL_38_14]